jgi:PAS domain S-box-containing protein
MPVRAASPLADPGRLAALAEAQLMDTPPEESFDRITRLAVRLLSARMAYISLLDSRRQFLKSVAAPFPLPSDRREVPIERSICQRVIEAGGPVSIRDLGEDALVGSSPLRVAMGMASYLGVPLSTPEGHVIGTLCVLGGEPHEWSQEDQSMLGELAAIVSLEIDGRRARMRADEATRALRSAESRFRALVEQNLAGIYAVRDGRFQYVSPRWAEMFGHPVAWFSDRSIYDVVHPDDRARVAQYIGERRGAGELRYDTRGIRVDGTVIHLEVQGKLAELDGRRAVIGIGLDVTERVRADREREEAIAARDRFYAMVSHELRTPVSAVMLYNDLLLSELFGALNEEQRDAVDRSQRCAGDLLALINDLLDLSKLEAGRLDTHLEEVELCELVDGAVAAVGPLAKRNGCSVSVDVSERPFVIVGDSRRIRQILLNLLTNAVKFGQGRPVDVSARRDEGSVMIDVADRGPGIAAADVPRIFEDFVQLDEHSSTGTGLGLPIARRLAEMLGGSLGVSSTPGAGSTFRLVLPG